MTRVGVGPYSPPMMNGWQHEGAFVVKFFPDTNPDEGRLCGRIEHVASGQTTRFESQSELLLFLNSVLRRIRLQFQQADTLIEEVPERMESDSTNG